MSRKFKAWHKVVGAPLAITSISTTAYLVNKWKELTLLDSTIQDLPPTETTDHEPEQESQPDRKEESGTGEEDSQEKEQGDQNDTLGDSGKNETTSGDEDSKDTDEVPSAPPSEPGSESGDSDEGSQEDSDVGNPDSNDPNSGSYPDGNPNVENKRTLEHEIKKMLEKVAREKLNWSTHPNSIKSAFEMHEVLKIGQQLLAKFQKNKKIN